MNGMEDATLPVKLYFVGFRGDWKAKGYFTGVHEYNKSDVCDACNASMVQPPYASDLGIDAAWTLTIKIPQIVDALQKILGWHPWIYFADCCHSLFLGHARDFVGSMCIVLSGVLFPGEGDDVALHELYILARAWAKANGHRLAIDDFSLVEFQVSDRTEDYPHFRGKAWDCKILCLWLADVLKAHAQQLPEEALAAESLGNFVMELDNSGIFLSDLQRQRAASFGEAHLQAYGVLAARAFQKFVPLWKIRPKTHHFHHKIVRRMRDGSRLNPRIAR